MKKFTKTIAFLLLSPFLLQAQNYYETNIIAPSSFEGIDVVSLFDGSNNFNYLLVGSPNFKSVLSISNSPSLISVPFETNFAYNNNISNHARNSLNVIQTSVSNFDFFLYGRNNMTDEESMDLSNHSFKYAFQNLWPSVECDEVQIIDTKLYSYIDDNYEVQKRILVLYTHNKYLHPFGCQKLTHLACINKDNDQILWDNLLSINNNIFGNTFGYELEVRNSFQPQDDDPIFYVLTGNQGSSSATSEVFGFNKDGVPNIHNAFAYSSEGLMDFPYSSLEILNKDDYFTAGFNQVIANSVSRKEYSIFQDSDILNITDMTSKTINGERILFVVGYILDSQNNFQKSDYFSLQLYTNKAKSLDVVPGASHRYINVNPTNTINQRVNCAISNDGFYIITPELRLIHCDDNGETCESLLLDVVANDLNDNLIYDTWFISDELALNQIEPNTPSNSFDIDRVCESNDQKNGFVSDDERYIIPNSSNFLIYPNPSTGVFNFDNKGKFEGNHLVIVQNIVGAKVFESQINFDNQINLLDLSHLDKGIYLVNIIDNQLNTIAINKVVLK